MKEKGARKLKELEKFFDKFGLIISRGDGGDTCANMGTLHFSAEFLRIFNRKKYLKMGTEMHCCSKSAWQAVVKLLNPVWGRWRRHCDPKRWYALAHKYGGKMGLDCQSRDQQKAIIFTLALKGDVERIKEFWKYQFSKGFAFLFMNNVKHNGQYPTIEQQLKYNPGKEHNYKSKCPDLIDLQMIAGSIRVFNGKWVKWICTILDLELLIDAIIYTYIKFDPDQRNFILSACLTYARHDTLPAKLARKIYGNKYNVQQIANDWWSEERNEAPMGEVLRPVIAKVWSYDVGA